MLAEKMRLVDERYLLQEQVAQGGPVELYFALDRQLQRQVALEILSASAAKDRAICDRFHLHQRSASAIHHPNVLEIYDAGEWNGRPYLVMERDAGQPPLGEGMAKDTTPDLSAALRMTRQAAEAVAFCRQAGLGDWPFSYKAVRLGTSDNAQIALLEDTHVGDTHGPFVSRQHAGDPPALAALFRLLISGTPDSGGMQPYLSTLPASVAVVLGRMELDAQDSFVSAGEVAEALKEIEAVSNDYTQANELPQAVQQGVVVVPGPDLQRTSSFAEAPTLAVAQQSAIPSVPYIPASESAAQASTMAAPAVAASSATPLDNSRPYVPSTISAEGEPARKRRVAPFLILPLLGLLLLFAGAAAFVAWPRDADSAIISNNQDGLPTSTTAAAAPPPVAAPELLGKSLDEATSIAEELGIGLSALDPVHSSDVPRDRVATQDPAPGVELPSGGNVMVALSLGPQPVQEDEDDDEEDDEGAAPPPEQKQPPGKRKDNGRKK